MQESVYVQVTWQACERGTTEETHQVLGSIGQSGFGHDLPETVPSFAILPIPVQGRFRDASSVALQERQDAATADDVRRGIRAWKLFLLLTLML